MDSFQCDLSYCLHLLVGLDSIEVDHGGRLSTMGGVRALVVVEGDPAPDADPCLRPGLDLPGFCGERLAHFPYLTLEGDGALEAERWMECPH